MDPTCQRSFQRSGFSLVEVVSLVAIVGILVLIGIVAIGKLKPATDQVADGG